MASSRIATKSLPIAVWTTWSVSRFRQSSNDRHREWLIFGSERKVSGGDRRYFSREESNLSGIRPLFNRRINRYRDSVTDTLMYRVRAPLISLVFASRQNGCHDTRRIWKGPRKISDDHDSIECLASDGDGYLIAGSLSFLDGRHWIIRTSNFQRSEIAK